MDQPEKSPIEAPPKTIGGILRRLGPGLIIAGAIVGSGELIATTKTGAQAGFWLLWLIIIGCTIKLFAQVEFGRYTVSSGKTTMTALNEVPGPRVLRSNWLLWYWLAMAMFSLAQLGGILGGVGQSMAMNLPIDGSFNRLLQEQDAWDARAAEVLDELRHEETASLASDSPADRQAAEKRIEQALVQRLGGPRPDPDVEGFFWTDDIYWAIIVALITAVLLVMGRYTLIQNVSVFFVVSFTIVTIFCVFALQQTEYAIDWGDLGRGLPMEVTVRQSGMADELRGQERQVMDRLAQEAGLQVAELFYKHASRSRVRAID